MGNTQTKEVKKLDRPDAINYDCPYEYIKALEYYAGMLEHDEAIQTHKYESLKMQIKEYLFRIHLKGC